MRGKQRKIEMSECRTQYAQHTGHVIYVAEAAQGHMSFEIFGQRTSAAATTICTLHVCERACDCVCGVRARVSMCVCQRLRDVFVALR